MWATNRSMWDSWASLRKKSAGSPSLRQADVRRRNLMPVKNLGRTPRITATLVALAAVLAGLGCAGDRAYRSGEKDELLEQWDRAVSDYARARELDPRNLRYHSSFDRAKRK